MARALRHFVQGQLWHITHRCHEKSFFLRSSRDRRRYLDWLLEARKRFGLCVLNYVVTCNHVHLLVKDTGRGVIAAACSSPPDESPRNSTCATGARARSGKSATTPPQ